MRILAVVSLLLVIAIGFTYAPVRENQITAFGERGSVLEDPLLHEAVDRAWLVRATAPTGAWSPLAWASLRLDAAVFGLENAAVLLGVNVALHALASVLLLLVLHRAGGALVPSLLAATFFGLHPLRVETVSRLDLRGDLLAVVLLLLAIWAYATRGPGRMSTRLELTLLLCMVLGVLASPLMALLPFLLIVLDAGPTRRFAPPDPSPVRSAFLEKLPLFIVALAATALFVTLAGSNGNAAFTAALDPAVRWQARVLTVGAVLVDMVWPVSITSLHSHPLHVEPWWRVGALVCLVLLVAGLGIRSARRSPWLALGAGWWALATVPMLFTSGPWAREERWVSMGAIGVAILVAFSLHAIVQRSRRARWLVALFAVLLGLGAAATREQVRVWKDEHTVLEHAVAVDPASWLVHDRLARSFRTRSDPERAHHHALRTVRLAPGYAAAQLDLAHAFESEGAVEEAMLLHENAAATGWGDRDADARLGLTLVRCGVDEAAIPLLENALARAPRSSDLHAGLALARARRGHAARAREHRDLALRGAPVTPAGRVLLVWLLATAPEPELRDAAAAVRLARHLLDPRSPDPDLLDALAAALAQQGAWSEAFESAQRAANAAAARGWKMRESEIRQRGLEYLQRRTWTEVRTIPPPEEAA